MEHVAFILYVAYIDVLNYWTWHCITSFVAGFAKRGLIRAITNI